MQQPSHNKNDESHKIDSLENEELVYPLAKVEKILS